MQGPSVQIEGEGLEARVVPFTYELTFDQGFYSAVNALQTLRDERNKAGGATVLVGIGGPPGAGKTFFSRKMNAIVEGQLLSLDSFFLPGRASDGNYDDHSVVDFELLAECLEDLKAGRDTSVPVYDYKTNTRQAIENIRVPKSQFILVDGVYALDPRLAGLFDLKISIVGGVHVDLTIRVLNDVSGRSRSGGTSPKSPRSTKSLFSSDKGGVISNALFPSFKSEMEPSLAQAEIKIENNFDPLGSLQDPFFILKTCKGVSDEAIKELLDSRQQYHSFKEEVSQEYYLYPPGVSPVEYNDWIRVRKTGGRGDGGKYAVMFRERLRDGDVTMSPRIQYEVSLKTIGGLLRMGYRIGAVLTRSCHIYEAGDLSIVVQNIDELEGRRYTEIIGKCKGDVVKAGETLELAGSYSLLNYIDIMQEEGKLSEDPNLNDKLPATLLNLLMTSDQSPIRIEGAFLSTGSWMAVGVGAVAVVAMAWVWAWARSPQPAPPSPPKRG